MDALKKADEAKRAAGESKAAVTQAPQELELAPLEAKIAEAAAENSLRQPLSSGGSPLPDLSLHIESVDADLAAVSTGSANKARTHKPASSTTANAMPKATNTVPRDDSERAAVRNVFTAKQTAEPRSAL